MPGPSLHITGILLLQSDAAGELDSLCKGSHICGGPWYGCESFCVQQNVFNKTLELIRSRSDVTKPALQLLKHKPISIQFYKPEFDEEYVRYVLLHGWWVDVEGGRVIGGMVPIDPFPGMK